VVGLKSERLCHYSLGPLPGRRPLDSADPPRAWHLACSRLQTLQDKPSKHGRHDMKEWKEQKEGRGGGLRSR
jgi:hypothetical protein